MSPKIRPEPKGITMGRQEEVKVLAGLLAGIVDGLEFMGL